MLFDALATEMALIIMHVPDHLTTHEADLSDDSTAGQKICSVRL